MGRSMCGPKIIPETHRKLLAVAPGREDDRCSKLPGRISLPLVGRAFRRPATEDEVAALHGWSKRPIEGRRSFEQGMQVAVTAVLVSPQFLFRVEKDPDVRSAARRSASSTTTSWPRGCPTSSGAACPTTSCSACCRRGKAAKTRPLREQQIRRMLADPKSEALVQNFAIQWLNLRLLDGVTPDPAKFPDFDAAAQGRHAARDGAVRARRSSARTAACSIFSTAASRSSTSGWPGTTASEGIRGDEFQRVSSRTIAGPAC